MDFRVSTSLLRPWKWHESSRLRGAVYLTVLGFASTLFGWMGLHLDSAGPTWWATVVNTVLLAAALGLGIAFVALASLWLVVLAFHPHRLPWLVVLMGFVMNAILLGAAVNRPQAFENMAAGILAALIIAVATTYRVDETVLSDEEP